MRSALVVLCLWSLLGTSRAQAEGAVALIWKGSKTQADAEAQGAAWSELGAVLEKTQLTVPQGFPKLVSSDTVPGLKPGFWVWLLGICGASDGAAALAHIKVLSPDTYSRDVKVAAKDGECPGVEGSALKARDEKLALPKGLTLRVFSQEEHQSPEDDEPGDTVTQTRYFFVLTGKKGEVFGVADAVGDEDFLGDPRQGPSAYRCSLEGIARSGASALVLTRSCRAGAAECGSTVSGDDVTTVTVRGTTLSSHTQRRNEQTLECGE
ncbi:hypothetical protein P2318_07970 [Myxococcaceae bacterium GXIMD 01537]